MYMYRTWSEIVCLVFLSFYISHLKNAQKWIYGYLAASGVGRWVGWVYNSQLILSSL